MFAMDNFGGHFCHIGKDEGSSKQLGLDFQVRVCHPPGVGIYVVTKNLKLSKLEPGIERLSYVN